MLERIRFMKVNHHKRFEYTPRYYDERKERIENLKKVYSGNDEKAEAKRALMRENIRTNWNSASSYSKQKKAANVRLIVILALILLAVYYIFGYVDIFTAEVIDLENLN